MKKQAMKKHAAEKHSETHHHELAAAEQAVETLTAFGKIQQFQADFLAWLDDSPIESEQHKLRLIR
ncbi:MAG: hypothetical protein K2X01_06840 [Cyanobacteria bacterium]|nr:hypothetical protein [Cyanobacteriota bacterium]